MKSILIVRLWQYLIDNNPDLVVSLQENSNVTLYLEVKVNTVNRIWKKMLAEGTPKYLVEEECLNLITEDLRPSRFNYLLTVLEEDFKAEYSRMTRNGTLMYEIINLIHLCTPIFNSRGFNEPNNRSIRCAIIETVGKYFFNNPDLLTTLSKSGTFFKS